MITLTAITLLAVLQQPWHELAGSASGGGISNSPLMSSGAKVAIDADGHPAVAWNKELPSGLYQVCFKRWDGSAWVELGGSATGDGISASPGNAYLGSMALDSAGRPVVAWTTQSLEPGNTLGDIFVKRWDGSAWVDAAGNPGPGVVVATPGESGSPCVAVDAADRPVVAWRETPGSVSKIWLLRWNGAAWEDLDGSASGDGISTTTGVTFNPAVDVDASGRPAVSWIDNSAGKFNVYFKRWSGSAWIELGGSSTGGGVSASQAHVLHYSMRVDAAGVPVIAWADKSGGPSQILVRSWNGSSWTGLGASDAPAGIGGSPQDANAPSLALDSGGRPVIAWSQYTGIYPAPANVEIHLKRWNGTDWAGLDGSATGGGISATPLTSPGPASVRINATGNIAVAWTEGLGTGHYELYLRRRSNALPVMGTPAQLLLDGSAPVPPGAILIGASGVLIRADASDPQGDSLRLEVEVRPLGTPFSSQPSAQGVTVGAGETASVPVDGLAEGYGYRWQARLVDDLGGASTWSPFGSQPSEADFVLRFNSAGSVTGAWQGNGESAVELPLGAQVLAGAGLSFRGTPHDPEGDRSRIEFEVRPVGTPFAGAATHSSPMVDDGSMAAATAQLTPGSWRWRHRTVDAFGAASEWLDFGGNGAMEADFEVLSDGSMGGRVCGLSSAGPALPDLLPLGLLLLLRRRTRFTLSIDDSKP